MINYRNIFLVDGIGAMTSALFLWCLTGRLHTFVGMPVPVMKALAIGAIFFCVYSIASFFVAGKHWKSFLRVIAMINLLYCIATFACLIRYWHLLKIPGFIYFALEIIVILILVSVETKLVREGKTQEIANRQFK